MKTDFEILKEYIELVHDEYKRNRNSRKEDFRREELQVNAGAIPELKTPWNFNYMYFGLQKIELQKDSIYFDFSFEDYKEDNVSDCISFLETDSFYYFIKDIEDAFLDRIGYDKEYDDYTAEEVLAENEDYKHIKAFIDFVKKDFDTIKLKQKLEDSLKLNDTIKKGVKIWNNN